MLPGAHRRTSRASLVLLQLLVFVTYIFGPTATFAEDPIPEPTPIESVEPEPSTQPTPEPTPAPSEPDPTPAPSEPDPTAAPDPTPQATDPHPTASPEPDPTPTPDPSVAPAAGTRPYLITFASGTDDARQLEILDSAGVTDESAIPQLSMRSVLLDETGYYDQLISLNAFAEVARVDLDRTRAVEAAPSDTSYADQWSLPKVGWDQLYGTVGIAGTSTVAVLDTGVDATHPDLDGVVLPGASVLDGSNGMSDPNGHGTWMAGIVAAETDNGIGIAGTAYAGVSVLPITVLGADGTGQDSDIIAGVVYAADGGADVILMSFSNPGYSPALQAAVDYAWSRGAVLVAATGNDGSGTATFPAGDRGVIGVTSTDQADTLAPGANYGPAAFMAAPGVDIATTNAVGSVATISGTSAAAAQVAGAAALLSANEPDLTNGVIVSRLARNADPAGTLGETGNGRLNLARAMADASLDEVQPAGAAPVGDGGPFVGPYLIAANNDAHVAPGWAPTNTVTTFSALYRKTTGGTVQHVRITLPVGYTTISVEGMAFSSGTWSTPVINQVARTIDTQLTAGTGLATNNVSWARIDVTATTPLVAQSGNAAEWLMQTFTNTAGTAGEQNDNPPVLIGTITNPSATITFVDAGGNAIGSPVVQNLVMSTLRVRITSVGSGIKYTDVAVPACFGTPSAVTATLSAGGNAYDTPILVTDGFIRLSGGSIANNGTLTVQFNVTPNCVSGTYLVSSDPSTNASNPPSGTNQSVSTTGGSLTVAAGLADLSITKTDSPDPVNVGGALTYTIGVSNAGPNDASAVKVVDTLPAGTTFVSATAPSNWNCVHVSGTVTCNRTGGNLAPGAAPNITITVLAPAASGSIINSATVSSPNDNTSGNNTATATTTVVNQADLSIAKTDGVTSVTAGGGTTYSYTVTVTNNGPAAAAGVSFTDTWPTGFARGTLPAGCVDILTGPDFTCSIGALANGASATRMISYTVPASTTASPQVNSVTVSATSPQDPTPANNTATDSNSVATSANLGVTKTDGVTAVTAGDGITYTYAIVVSNAGPSDAQSVSITDTWPAGFTRGTLPVGCSNIGAGPDFICSLGTIAAGSSMTRMVSYTVPAGTTSSPQVNSVTANSTTADPSTPNTATDSNTVTASADLTVAKSGPATAVAGAAAGFDYSLTVTNGGPSTHTGGITVTDTLPAGTTFSAIGSSVDCSAVGQLVTCSRSITLAPADTTSFTVHVTVGAAVADGTVLSNSATVSSTGTAEGDTTNNGSNTTTTTVITSANLSITKSDSPDPVIAGNNLTYTLSVDSTGPSDALDVVVSDALPAGTSFVSADNGGTYDAGTHTVSWNLGTVAAADAADELSLVVSVPSSTSASAVLSNTASVSSDTTDPAPANNSDTETTDVDRSADVADLKVATPEPVRAGESLFYTITVTNNGPSDADAVTLVDTLPAGVSNARYCVVSMTATCTFEAEFSAYTSGGTISLGTLPSGAARIVKLTVDVDSDVAEGTTLTNVAVVGSAEPDPTPANNTATETTAVIAEADLSISKDDSPDPVIAGNNLTYTLSVDSTGPSDALNVSVSDTLPAGTTFVSADNGGTYNSGTNTVNWNLGTVAAADAADVLSFVVTVDPSRLADLSNTASVTSDTTDPDATNNSDTETTTVITSANLSITKSDSPDPVIAGNNLTYTLSVDSTGPSDALDVVVSDALPAGTSFVSADNGGTYDAGTHTVSWNLGTVAAADAADELSLVVSVPSSTSASAVLSNTASVSSDTTDPAPANNSDTETTDVDRSADLTITKLDEWAGNDHDPVTAGASGAYQLTVTNNGPSSSTGFTVTDTLPAGFSYDDAASSTACDAGTGNTVVCTRTSDLAAGGSASFVIAYDADAAIPDGTLLTNSVSVAGSASDTDPDATNNSDSEDTTVIARADLTVAKSGPATAVAGAATGFDYTLTVTNGGPSVQVGGFSVTDTLPAGLTFQTTGSDSDCTASGQVVTCTVTSGLAVNGTESFIVHVTLASTAAAGSTLSNAASVASNGTAEGDTTNNTSNQVDTTVVRSADLAITKLDQWVEGTTFINHDPVTAGASGAYQLTVTNNGPSSSTGFTVTDTLPAGFSYDDAASSTACDAGTGNTVVCTRTSDLAAGGSASFVIAYDADAAIPDGTLLTNSVSVAGSASDTDPDATNNSDSEDTTVIAEADLSITKDDSPDPVIAGNNLTYTLSVDSTGPSDALNVSVSDTLPAGTTFVSADNGGTYNSGTNTVNWNLGTVAAADAADVLSFVVTVDPSRLADLSNTASVTSDTTDPDATNNSDTETTTVITSANLSITKSDSPDPVIAGNNLTYTLSVDSTGPSDALDVVVSDALPAGTSFVSADNGGTYDAGTHTVSWNLGTVAAADAADELSLVVSVPSSTSASAVLSNTASVSSDTTDPAPANNSDTETTDVDRSADVADLKVATPEPVRAGESLFYTITVTNNGPSDADAVTLVDTLPAGVSNARYCVVSMTATCTFEAEFSAYTSGGTISLGTLPSGAARIVKLTVDVDSDVAEGTTLTNVAVVGSAEPDPTPANNTATETTAVIAEADLSISKDDSPDPVIAGNNLTYTLSVDSTGPSDALNVSVSDTLPAGTTFVSADNGGTYNSGTNTVNWNLGTVAAADAADVLSFVVTVDPSRLADLSNTASVTSDTTDPDATNNSDTETTTVITSANLSITKSDSPDPVIAGNNLTYTLSVDSTGPSDALDVVVSDALPAGTSFVSADNGGTYDAGTHTVSWNLGTVAAADAADELSLVVSVPSSTSASAVLSNTASVSSDTTDPAPANNSDTETTDVDRSADLTITKLDEWAGNDHDPVTAGASGAYQLTVTNNGPSSSTGFTVTDTLPAGFSYDDAASSTACDAGTGNTVVCTRTSDLAAGGSASFVIAYDADAAIPDGTLLTNSVSVAGSASDTDPDATNNSDSEDTTVIARADLTVAKSGPATAVAGAATGFDYTLTVTNGGPSVQVGGFSVTDTLPAGLTFQTTGSDSDCTASGQVVTCTVTSGLAVNGTESFIVHVTLASTAAAGSTLSNAASVASNGTAEGDTTNNTSNQVDTTVVRSADLAITKLDQWVEGTTFINHDPVTAGASGAYQLTVTNNGPSSSTGFTVTDTLPAGFSYDDAASSTACDAGTGNTVVCTRTSDLAAGGSASFVIAYDADASIADGTVLTNSVSVAGSASDTDPDTTNDSDSEDTTVIAEADLSISKTDSPDPVIAGNNLTYTLSVDSTGPSDALDVVVSDALPAGTSFVSADNGGTYDAGTHTVSWNLGTVAAADAADELSLVVSVPSSTSASAVLSNTASVSSDTTDPAPANNSDTETTDVDRSADVADLKVATPEPVRAGESLFYTITVTNNGPSDADAVTLVDTLPAGVSNARYCVVSMTATCTFEAEFSAYTSGGTISLGTLPSGAARIVKLTVDVDSDVAEGTTLTNVAVVGSAEPDPTPANNTATETTAVIAEADLSISKDDSPDPVIAGNNLTYTLSVDSTGPSDALNVSVSDTLPAGTTFVSADNGGTYNSGTNTVNWNLGTVAAADAADVLSFVVTVDPSRLADLSNTASVTSDTTDPDATNNSDTETTTVITSANLSITKTDSPDPVIAGNNLTYTLSVDSTGPSDALDVVVSDALPAGTSFVSADNGGTYDAGTHTVSWNLGTVAAADAADELSLVVSVPSSTSASAVLSNTASVSSDTTDPAPANNSDTETTDVDRSADVTITKLDEWAGNDHDPVTAGASGAYQLTVTNNGPSSSTGFTVTDTLPAGFSYDDAASSTACDAGTGNTVVCTRTSDLAAGGSASFVIAYDADAAIPDGTLLTNSVSVAGSASDTDPDTTNDSDSEDTTVIARADLSITKSDSPDPVIAGNNLTYTLSVDSTGPSDALDVVVSDTLPAGTSFVSADNGGTYDSGTHTVSWSLGTVAAADAADELSLVVSVPSSTSASAVLSNTASVSSDTTDPAPANNSDTETTDVDRSADLTITKLDEWAGNDHDPVTAGASGAYQLTVTNNGPSSSTGFTVTDTLPTGFSYDDAASSTACDPGTGNTVVCTRSTDLAAGGSASFVIVYAAGHSTAGTLQTNNASVVGSSSDSDSVATNNGTFATTTVIDRTTSTAVSCTPVSVVVNQATVCTATVTDTDQGQKADPTGTVTFSAAPAASGTFTLPGTTCTLNPDGSSLTYTSSCTVTYEPTNNAGNHVITGTYNEASSTLHRGSNGTFTLSVGKRTTTTTLVCTPLVAQIGTVITCKATVTDVESAGTKTNPQGTVTFSPAGTTASCTLASDPTYTDRSSCSITYTATAADVIGVVASYSGSNVHKPSTSDRLPIVFYDPNGGFVTGGGYIMQGPNMTPSGMPIGKNNYGFVAKYQKNSTIPVGEMEFQCKVCGINFHGKTYDWLVIKTLSDGRKHAQAQGSGTINGTGDYGFIVTAIDGGNKPDYFRIRIWNKATGVTVYDSQPTDNDTQLPTALSEGGNIVIHTK